LLDKGWFLKLGVAGVDLLMFLRKLKNRSGSTSIQIISKATGKYKVVKTIGVGSTGQQIQRLWYLGQQELERLNAQVQLFVSPADTAIEQAFNQLQNSSVRTIGPELIFGKIYDSIGFGLIKEHLLRHLVIARLAFPLSKLKTIEYLYRYQGVRKDIAAIYRFLDKLNNKLKQQAERIAFEHTKKCWEVISLLFFMI
jgi:hypothetical protein